MTAKILKFKKSLKIAQFTIPVRLKAQKKMSPEFIKYVENNFWVWSDGTVVNDKDVQQRPYQNGLNSKYLKLSISFKNERHYFYLHRVVFYSFNSHLNTEENAELKLQIDHRNGQHRDCRIENLRLVTRKQNIEFMFKRHKGIKLKLAA